MQSKANGRPEKAKTVTSFQTRHGLTAFRWGWSVFVIMATTVPYLLNRFSTPPGYHYTWILPPYPEDSYGYMAWEQQAAHGAWLFKIKYTALPHDAFLFHPFFLVCGWISSIFSCDIGIVFLAVKTVGVGIFLLTFYSYIDYLGLTRIQSITASILVGVSSGFGGIFGFSNLINPSQGISADIGIMDMTTFESLLWNPLWVYSLILMIMAMFWLDRGTRDARASDLWLSGLATGVMALIHPYSQPLLLVFAAIVIIARKRAGAAGYLCRYFAASLPFVIYVAFVSEFNPIVSKHNPLGEMDSPPFAAYALGFGLPLILCVAGLAVERGQLIKRYWQIILWFLLSVTFAYLPFWFQMKFIFGAHIPLCIMAGISFDLILNKCSSVAARDCVLVLALVVLLPLVASTPMYLLAVGSTEVAQNERGSYYISDELMQGLKFLKASTNPDQVVFANYETSRLIPAISGNTVVWGHWAMSVDLKEREAWINHLFAPQSNWDDEQRSRDFWSNDIQFIFADGDIKQSVEQYPYKWRVILKDADKVFENNSVVIYQRRKT